MEGDSKTKFASAKEVFEVYWVHTKQYPWRLTVTVVSLVGLQAAMLGAPLYLRNFFNLLATHSPDAATIAQLTFALIVVTGLYFGEWVSRRIEAWSNMAMQSKVMTDLYRTSYDYLLHHSYNFFISRFAGSLTHRVNKFAKAYETLFDSIVISFFPTSIFVLGAIIILGTRHLLLGAMLAGWVVLFLTFQIWVSKLRQPLREARAEADTRVTGTLADAISNHQTIILFSGVDHEKTLFAQVVERWRAATYRSWRSDEWIWAGVGIFMIAIEVGLLYGAMIFWSRGLLTIGDFVLIQAYLLTTFDRLVSINRELRRFYDAFADSSEVVALLNLPHEVKNKRGAKPLDVSKGEVWFDNVNFWYNTADNKHNYILKDFNVTIAGGEKVALVGPSGAGKSTVTKLLLRMYDLPEGEIKIDKQVIAEVTQDSLRDAVSFVPQEPILFHRSLIENIRYGRRDATDEEVIEAAKKAHCHEFISALPQTYNTFVGERGIKLSGGERQRVAIARAILKNAPILVLDEATSSLDSESEALIQDALEVLMEDKTVLVIAHRLSTIMKMDRIVVMEHGTVAATGTHLELVNQPGLYRKLWSIQAGGFLGGAKAAVDKNEDVVELIEELADGPEDK